VVQNASREADEDLKEFEIDLLPDPAYHGESRTKNESAIYEKSTRDHRITVRPPHLVHGTRSGKGSEAATLIVYNLKIFKTRGAPKKHRCKVWT
jgi:hypothetical protein